MSIQALNPKEFAKAEAFVPFYRAELAQWPIQPEERVVDTKTERTHLLVWGPPDAPPLVVLSGAGGNALGWWLQAEAFATKNRVYALELPGNHGLSVATRPLKKTADIMRWLDECLDALELTRVDLLGMSWGGMVAAHYALHAPSRVSRLVLIAPGFTFLPLQMSVFWHSLPVALFRTRGSFDRFFRWLGRNENANHQPYEKNLQVVVRLAYAGWHHFGMPQTFVPKLLDEELRAVSCPTMVVIGEHEVNYDARKALSRATALIPYVQTALIPGAGHDIMWSQPERLNATITGFLSQP